MNPLNGRRSVAALLVLALALVGFASACSSSSSSSKFTQNGVTVSGAWATEAEIATGKSDVYFTITNNSGLYEKLMSVSVATSVAKSAQIQESDAVDSTGGVPAMGMGQVNSIPVLSGDSVNLEPGGLHVLLMEIAAPLKAGDKIDLQLGFLNAGVMKVTATVKAG